MTDCPGTFHQYLLKARSVAFVKVVLLCLVLSVFLVLYYARFDDVRNAFTPILTRERDNKTFYVEKYNFSHGFLKLIGHYGQHENNSRYPTSDTVMHVEGIENLLHQIKPQIIRDKKLIKAELPNERFFKADRNVKGVRCNRLFKNDQFEIAKAKNLTIYDNGANEQISANSYIKMTSNCVKFKKNRGYITSPLTKIEEDFPIAFSILMYKDIWQFERLLRAIYQPQNLYCLHVDAKADVTVLRAVTSISRCFDNVFFTSKRFAVEWGTMTVLEPELSCMEDLWKRSRAWKYFINLTGQEFPLRTNYELVQILTAYNGANDIESTVENANRDRWQFAGDPPHDLTPVKGSVHIVVSRGYVDHVLHDPKIGALLNWTRKVKIPDEVFFSTINHNPSLNVPGAYLGLPETDTRVKPFVARFKNWGLGMYNWPCAGQRVRLICVFGIGDLPLLASRKELFVNKLYSDYEHFALDCLEELQYNHTRDEYLGRLEFDARWYSRLGFVKNKVES